jgi:hypothetical protein
MNNGENMFAIQTILSIKIRFLFTQKIKINKIFEVG